MFSLLPVLQKNKSSCTFFHTIFENSHRYLPCGSNSTCSYMQFMWSLLLSWTCKNFVIQQQGPGVGEATVLKQCHARAISQKTLVDIFLRAWAHLVVTINTGLNNSYNATCEHEFMISHNQNTNRIKELIASTYTVQKHMKQPNPQTTHSNYIFL